MFEVVPTGEISVLFRRTVSGTLAAATIGTTDEFDLYRDDWNEIGKVMVIRW